MTTTAVALSEEDRALLVDLLWQKLAKVDPKMFASLWRAAHRPTKRPDRACPASAPEPLREREAAWDELRRDMAAA